MISIYISKSISALFGRFLEGDEFRLVTIPKSEFPAGLTQRQKPYLGSVG
jgi:hypothetical protein